MKFSSSAFTAEDYRALYSEVFSGAYPGYQKNVREVPNGDGNVDDLKRYAHVAVKYFRTYRYNPIALLYHLCKAHSIAMKVAEALKVPAPFLPSFEHSALRVLEYPAGAGSHWHRDMDLFTLMMYRNRPDKFEMEHAAPVAASKINAQVHLGELAEQLGLGKAPLHRVVASDLPQHSVVYFAVPAPDAELPSGITVGAWLAERIPRSRTVEQ